MDYKLKKLFIFTCLLLLFKLLSNIKKNQLSIKEKFFNIIKTYNYTLPLDKSKYSSIDNQYDLIYKSYLCNKNIDTIIDIKDKEYYNKFCNKNVAENNLTSLYKNNDKMHYLLVDYNTVISKIELSDINFRLSRTYENELSVNDNQNFIEKLPYYKVNNKNPGIQFTISYWININKVRRNDLVLLQGITKNTNKVLPLIKLVEYRTAISIKINNKEYLIDDGHINLDRWNHVTHVLYGNNLNQYVDGKLVSRDNDIFDLNLNDDDILFSIPKTNVNNVYLAKFNIFSLALSLQTIILLTHEYPINYLEMSNNWNKYEKIKNEDHSLTVKYSRNQIRPFNILTPYNIKGSTKNYYYAGNEKNEYEGNEKILNNSGTFNYQTAKNYNYLRPLQIFDDSGVEYTERRNISINNQYLLKEYRQPTVTISPSGRVYLNGTVRITKDNVQIIGNLPRNVMDEGQKYKRIFRPDNELMFHIGIDVGYKLTIKPNGNIILNRNVDKDIDSLISLDGISYSPTVLSSYYSFSGDNIPGGKSIFSMEEKCRYIRIYANPNAYFLTFCGIEIYIKGEEKTRTEGIRSNIALGKSCRMSSIYNNNSELYGPQIPVNKDYSIYDSNFHPYYDGGSSYCGGKNENYSDENWESPVGSYIMTKIINPGNGGIDESIHWWEIDLANEYIIDNIVIYNRLDKSHPDGSNNAWADAQRSWGIDPSFNKEIYPNMNSLEGGKIILKNRYGKELGKNSDGTSTYGKKMILKSEPHAPGLENSKYCNDATRITKSRDNKSCRNWKDKFIDPPSNIINEYNIKKNRYEQDKSASEKAQNYKNQYNSKINELNNLNNKKNNTPQTIKKNNEMVRNDEYYNIQNQINNVTRERDQLKNNYDNELNKIQNGNDVPGSNIRKDNYKSISLEMYDKGSQPYFSKYDINKGPESVSPYNIYSSTSDNSNPYAPWAQDLPPYNKKYFKPHNGLTHSQFKNETETDFSNNYCRNPRFGEDLGTGYNNETSTNPPNKQLWCYTNTGNTDNPERSLCGGPEYGEFVNDIKKKYWTRKYYINFSMNEQTTLKNTDTGWVNFDKIENLCGKPWRKPHFYKLENTVYLTGVISYQPQSSFYKNEVFTNERNEQINLYVNSDELKNNNIYKIDSIIARLPPGYRPSSNIVGNVTNEVDYGRIEIDSFGYIKVKVATLAKNPLFINNDNEAIESARTQNWISFDGIKFQVEDNNNQFRTNPIEFIPNSGWNTLGDYLKDSENFKSASLMDSSVFTLSLFKNNNEQKGMNFGKQNKFNINGSLTISFFIRIEESIQSNQNQYTIFHIDNMGQGSVYLDSEYRINYKCGYLNSYHIRSNEQIKIRNKNQEGRSFVAIVRDTITKTIKIYIKNDLDSDSPPTKNEINGSSIYNIKNNPLLIGRTNIDDSIATEMLPNNVSLFNLNLFIKNQSSNNINLISRIKGVSSRDYGIAKYSIIKYSEKAQINNDPDYKLNLVKLQGTINSNTKSMQVGNVIFRLPLDCRPQSNIRFYVTVQNKAIILEINKAGEAKLVNNIVDNYESYLSLDGIEFLTLKT